ncbi:hypothetical protein [Micromonospora sonneratiae]|uniref:Uncharacterized protein n=1 Tax=Micromonospora sonneratiae TaxID=1184706 RepID=A0ABW3YE65_9ACTN
MRADSTANSVARRSRPAAGCADEQQILYAAPLFPPGVNQRLSYLRTRWR